MVLSSLVVLISTEVCTCCLSRCTPQWVSQLVIYQHNKCQIFLKLSHLWGVRSGLLAGGVLIHFAIITNWAHRHVGPSINDTSIMRIINTVIWTSNFGCIRHLNCTLKFYKWLLWSDWTQYYICLRNQCQLLICVVSCFSVWTCGVSEMWSWMSRRALR